MPETVLYECGFRLSTKQKQWVQVDNVQLKSSNICVSQSLGSMAMTWQSLKFTLQTVLDDEIYVERFQ